MTGKQNRTQAGSARLSVFLQDSPDGFPMVVPSSDDTSMHDLGDRVVDRIEANSQHTIPDGLPEPGETKPLGVVHWDESGFPTRLELRSGEEVEFTTLGSVASISEPDDETADSVASCN